MLKLNGSVCIEAPSAKVWAVLSDLESIQSWVGAIRSSYCPAQDRGVGAVRVCELKQANIRETIIAWDEGRSFTYRGEGAPMMKTAINTWTVEAREHRTLVTTSAVVEIKGGFAGVLLEPLVRLMSDRLSSQSLAALKYLVEHGKPYPGRIQNLIPAPTIC